MPKQQQLQGYLGAGGGIGALGIGAWALYYILSHTLPMMEESHKEETTQLLDAWHEEMAAEREYRRADTQDLIDAVQGTTDAVKELTREHR